MNKRIKNFQWKWFLFLIPFIVIGFYLWYLNSCPIDKDFDKAGKLGDSFGIVNTLFSGLAFIALVITIYLQQQDMKDTKVEIKKQNFENTFFKMIDLYNNVVKDLELKRPIQITDILPDGTEQIEYINYEILGQKLFIGQKDCQGKEVIVELLNIYNIYKKALINSLQYENKKDIYKDFYTKYEEVISHYFRIIYHILDFIDKSGIGYEDKRDYIKIFLTQFSKKDLKLLYLHSRSEVSNDLFHPIFNKYGFKVI